MFPAFADMMGRSFGTLSMDFSHQRPKGHDTSWNSTTLLLITASSVALPGVERWKRKHPDFLNHERKPSNFL